MVIVRIIMKMMKIIIMKIMMTNNDIITVKMKKIK